IARQGILVLERGLDVNSEFSYAYRTLGVTHFWLARWQADNGTRPDEHLAEAQQVLLRAIAIRDSDTYAHEMLARVLLEMRRFEPERKKRQVLSDRIRAELETSLAINPSNRQAEELLREIDLPHQ
ncbi:MAG: hypothetical protein K8R59_08900, partial [Thermoanaerobaculales bacterium]|nr:hypothetical protein [Thermoanaerobaculales bacterium]